MTQEQSDQDSLLDAASKGELEAVKTLIKSGSNPNTSNDLGQTPLHWAVAGGHTDVASTLLNAGADPDAKDNGGLAPLHVAAKKDNLEIFKVLLNAGADQDTRDNNGLTPRDLVDNDSYGSVTNALLSPAANSQLTNNSGPKLRHTTSLQNPQASTGSAPMGALQKTRSSPQQAPTLQSHQVFSKAGDQARGVLRDGPKVIPTKGNKTLIAEATISLMRESENRQKHREELFNGIIKEKKIEKRTKFYYYLRGLVYSKDVAESQYSVERRLFFRSVLAGQTELVQALLQEETSCRMCEGVSLYYLYLYCQMKIPYYGRFNEESYLKMTPLHCAALAGHVDIVNILIEKDGRDFIDLPVSIYNWSPLHCAARNGHADVAKALIEAGASLDIKDKDKKTPLCLALRHSHEEVASVLIQAGADISKVTINVNYG